MRRPIASKRRPITYCRRQSIRQRPLVTEQKMTDLGQIYHLLVKYYQKFGYLLFFGNGETKFLNQLECTHGSIAVVLLLSQILYNFFPLTRQFDIS